MNEQYITLVGKVCAPRYENVFTPEVRSELPIEASSEGRHLKDWAIYGNNRPNHIDETQNNLPIEVSAYGGNATDWEIYGNDNPVVRDDTGVLPMEIGSNGDELTDYTIYGNNNPVVEEEQKILPMELSATAGNVRDWEIYGNNDPVVENKTGVLPIEASATAGNLLDWEIYGNDNIGKNIFSLADFVNVNKNNVVMTADKSAGLVSVYTTDTPSANTQATIGISPAVTGNYLMSGIPSNVPNLNIQMYCWDSAASERAKAWDRTTDSLTCNKNNTEVEVYLEAGRQYTINVQVLTNYGTQTPVIVSPMVRLDGTSSTFEPYTVGIGEQTKNLADVESAYVNEKITVNALQNSTGTVWGTTSGGASYIAFALYPSFEEGKTYTISFNNLYTENTMSRVTIRRKNTYQIRYSSSLTTYGELSFSFTYTATEFPDGAYVSIILNNNTGAAGELHIENLMLVEGSTASQTYIPYGYEVPMDIRHKTKNLYQLPNDATSNGVTFTGDSTDGTVTANGTNTGTTSGSLFYELTNYPDGDYYLSGCADGGNTTTYNIHIFDTTTSNKAVSWDETTISDRCYSMSQQIPVHLYSSHMYRITIQVASGYTVDNIVFKPMLRVADTSPEFEPYFLTNHKDIYIGNSPLTQGQSITKVQSGQDITLFSGDNIIDTSLYNKPDVSITYNSSALGVGEFNAPQVYTGWEQGTRTTSAQGGETYSQLKVSNTARVRNADLIPVVTPFYYEINSGYQIGATFFDENGLSLGTSSNVGFLSSSYIYTGVGKYVSFAIKNDAGTDITPTSDFVVKIASPYGYQIPISVTSGQTTTPYNYYIGNSPLTAGQSISKTSTGTDIALLSGTNTISTTLGNKPEMRVKHDSSTLGVGERTVNLFDKGDIEELNAYIDVNGVIAQSQLDRTLVIPVEPSTTYTLVMSRLPIGAEDNARIALYTTKPDISSTGILVATINPTLNINRTFTTTDETHYLGFKFCRVDRSDYQEQLNTIMLVEGSTAPQTHISYGYQIPVLVTGGRTENLFDKNATDTNNGYVNGKYIRSDESTVSNDAFAISEYIPINANQSYFYKWVDVEIIDAPRPAIVFYDSNKGYISGEAFNNRGYFSFVTPQNAAFVRLSVLKSEINTVTMLISGSTAPDHYIPYHNTAQTNIYVGTSPLTQGQSINKATAQVDIDMYEGDNVIDVAIDNKPQMNMVYNSDIMGVGEKTKNIIDLTNIEAKTAGNVTMTPNPATGFITVTTTGGAAATAECVISNIYLPDGLEGNYYLSGSPNGGNETTKWDIYPWDVTTGARPKKWDGVTDARSSVGDTPQEVQFIAGHTYRVGVRVRKNANVNGLVFKPMIHKADTTSEFVPFGYQIPLTVTSGQTATPYNYFVGDSPITAGQSISKSSMGTDIELLSGTNTISTTMGNKPEMRIDYESAEVGVGLRTKNYVNVETGTTAAGIKFTFDPATGTVTANGTATATAQCRVVFNSPDLPNNSTVPLGNYYFSGCPSGGGGSKYNCYSWDYATGARSKQWDGTTSTEQDNGQGNCEVLINGHSQSITIRIAPGYTANNLVFKPMLRRADTTSEFEPYGYKVPVKVYDDEDNSETYDVYIGSQLLVSGASINKDGTGVEIELNEGINTIKTDLYNEPEMYIK